MVAGCLPKAERRTVERFAGAGASMLGPGSLDRALEVADAALAGKKAVELGDTGAPKAGLPRVRLNGAVGIIQISSGCLSECSFCQTKLAKGGLRSYRIGDVVRQARADMADGCREFWLTSTDNGCYGMDIGADLPGLVDAVAGMREGGPEYMVRVGMMNPMYVPRIRAGLLRSFRSPRVYRFLHIPVQSGSGSVLRAMRRSHTAATFADAAAAFRAEFGRFTIATDVITGFPGETDGDFGETVRMLEEARPDVVNVSRYSARPGTEAAGRRDEAVDARTAKRRSGIVSRLAAAVSLEANRRWIGWKGRVMFAEAPPRAGDGDGEPAARGRNPAYKPVYVKTGGGRAPAAGFRTVRITGATAHALAGEIAA